MSAQDKMTVSHNPFAAEAGALQLVDKKQKKKARVELAHLASVAKTLEEELKGAKTSQKPAGGEDFGKAMAEFALCIQMLEAKIAKFGDNKSGFDGTVAKAEVKAAKDKLNKVKHDLHEIAEKRKKAGIFSKVVKALTISGAALSAILAVVTVQPELFAVTAVSLAAATGGTKELTKGVTDVVLASLKEIDPKATKKEAELIATVLVTITVVLLTAAMGPAGTAAEADALVEESGEASSSKLLGALKRFNVFRRLPKAANMAIVNGVMTLSASGFTNALLNVIPMSEKKRQQDELIIEAVLMLLSFAAMVGPGTAMFGLEAGKIGNNTELTIKVAQGAKFLLAFSGLSEAGASGGQQAYEIEGALYQGDFAKDDADFKLLHETMRMSTTQSTEDQNHQTQTLKAEHMGAHTISGLMKGVAAFATLFTEYSPV